MSVGSRIRARGGGGGRERAISPRNTRSHFRRDARRRALRKANVFRCCAECNASARASFIDLDNARAITRGTHAARAFCPDVDEIERRRGRRRRRRRQRWRRGSVKDISLVPRTSTGRARSGDRWWCIAPGGIANAGTDLPVIVGVKMPVSTRAKLKALRPPRGDPRKRMRKVISTCHLILRDFIYSEILSLRTPFVSHVHSHRPGLTRRDVFHR